MELLKTTLVMGVSAQKSDSYAVKACRRLAESGFAFVPFGRVAGVVLGIPVIISPEEAEANGPYHTLTLYLNHGNQAGIADWLLSLKPKRIIFNPGAENRELAKRATELGIEALEACTLVMLATEQY